jgi:hypothetical protein
MYTVLLRRDLTHISDRRSRDSAARNVLGDPVTQPSNAIPGEHEVEPSHHPAIVVDEQVIGADAGRLLRQQTVVLLGEALKLDLSPIGHETSEVGPVGQLESKDRLRVVASQGLQLGHPATLATTTTLTHAVCRRTCHEWAAGNLRRQPICSKRDTMIPSGPRT